MSLENVLKTWKKSESDEFEIYSKNGFQVYVPYHKDSAIQLRYLTNLINKQVFSLDQGIYFCEGRMFKSDPEYTHA